jgi:hypothetical protein
MPGPAAYREATPPPPPAQAPYSPPQAPATIPAQGPVVLRPEPRQLPNRPMAGEVVARQMPDPIPGRAPRGGHPARLPGRNSATQRLARLLMLVLFLVASGALVYGVLTILKMQPEQDGRSRPAVLQKPTAEPGKATEAGRPTVDSGKSDSPALHTPAPELPAISQPPQLPDGLEPVSPWKDAEAVLEKFLAASSLAERLPLIETKTAEAELAASCLASPLPPARKMVPEFRESNAIEDVIDCYYTVEFESPDNPAQLQTILVRSRGKGGKSKVVVDPFLDTFGGRLAAYASAPSDKAGVFQVVVYAVASCTDPNIPNREKKLTLKLLSSDNTKEISRAYFGRQSKIGEMLEDGTYSLSYGNSKACTVMLRWNTEEDSRHPFLEAIAIKALDWNS